MKYKTNIYWIALKLGVTISAIAIANYKIFTLTKSYDWVVVTISISAILITSIISYELELKPENKRINEKVDLLLKHLNEDHIEIITNYDEFINRATYITSNARGRLYTLRVHTSAEVNGDESYFKATSNNLLNNTISLYRRIILVKDKKSFKLAEKNIKMFGGHEQVEVKIWHEDDFPSMFELLLSQNEALIIFKSDEGPPSYCVSLKNKPAIEILFGYFDKFWKDKRAVTFVRRGKLTKEKINNICSEMKKKCEIEE